MALGEIDAAHRLAKVPLPTPSSHTVQTKLFLFLADTILPLCLELFLPLFLTRKIPASDLTQVPVPPGSLL